MASLERHYISTGHLPAPEMVQSLVQDTHRRSKSNNDGKNSQAYPALLPNEIQTQVELGNIICVSNNQLRSVMEKTTATLQQVREALRMNTEAQLRALKIGLLFMAGRPLLAVIRPTSPEPTFRSDPKR
jgi:hypothetical protein